MTNDKNYDPHLHGSDQVVVDRKPVEEKRSGAGWLCILPLLLIPLLIWGFFNRNHYSNVNNGSNQAYVASTPHPSNNNNSTVTTGIGGGPGYASPSPTAPYSPQQSHTSMPTSKSSSSSSGVVSGIGGGAGSINTPSGAPSTGRGGN